VFLNHSLGELTNENNLFVNQITLLMMFMFYSLKRNCSQETFVGELTYAYAISMIDFVRFS